MAPERPGGVLAADSAHAPAWLVRSAAVGARLLILAVLVWLLAGLAVQLTMILVAVLVAVLLAGVFAPAMQWATEKRVPEWAAAGTVVLLLLVLVMGTGAGIGARIAGELPELRDQLQSASSDLSGALGVELPSIGSSSSGGSSGGRSSTSSDGSSSSSSGGSSEASGGGSSVMDGALGSLRTVADVLIGFFLTLALTFLFLKNGARMWGWWVARLAGRVREDVDAAGRAAWTTVGAYVRGLTIVAMFDAIGIGLGLLLLGIPLALTLAVLQFVASYIPTVGSFVAGAVAVAVAYVDGGLGTAALVLGLVVLVQQIGNDVIEPYVMQRKLPLNAAMVLIAVTAGGLLWGIAGALLFVPLLAATSAATREVWERHGSPPIAGSAPVTGDPEPTAGTTQPS